MSAQRSSPFSMVARGLEEMAADKKGASGRQSASKDKPLVSAQGHVAVAVLMSREKLLTALAQKPETVPALVVVGSPNGAPGSGAIPLARIWAVEAGQSIPEQRIQLSHLRNRVHYMASRDDKGMGLGPSTLVFAPDAAKVPFRNYAIKYDRRQKPVQTADEIVKEAKPLAILAPLTWEPGK